MYKFYFLILSISVLSSCTTSSQEEDKVEEVTVGDIADYQLLEIPGSTYKNATKYDQSGFLLERGQVKNSQKTGTWVTYHSGGSHVPKSIINYTEGVANGPYFEFNTQGQMEMRAFYKNNKLDGEWASYKFARPTREAFYKDGVLNGVLREYISTTGKVQREVEYKDGKMHGKFIVYDEDGNVTLEYEYEDGEKVEK